MTPQQVDFAARVSRIEAGAGSSTSVIFVGMDDRFVVDRTRKRRRTSAVVTLITNALYPLSMLVSCALGGFAYMLGRYLRFHLSGITDAPLDPDMEMIVDAATGLVISLLLSQLDRLRQPDQMLAKVLGVLGGLLGFHNLVHLYPQTFAVLFSELWVTKLITSTEAHSLLWRGISFVF